MTTRAYWNVWTSSPRLVSFSYFRSMNFWRKLLWPLGILYGLAMECRNALYRFGIFRSHQFEVPVVCIGNLSTGGTGKTPHVIYWAHLLQQKGFQVAVLSRGYGRKTKGFRVVDAHDRAMDVGDEPLEIKRALHSIHVVVCANRVEGIHEIQRLFSPDVILMDDGMQHRAVTPGLTVCLTAFDQPFDRDMILPAGNLREYARNVARADAVVLTKCPESEGEHTINRIKDRALTRGLNFDFSRLIYGNLYDFHRNIKVELPKSALIITGIANSEPFMGYLRSKMRIIEHIAFRDHYPFAVSDIQAIMDRHGVENAVITTRKDATRLAQIWKRDAWGALYVLPVEVEMNSKQIDQQIIQYVESTERSK